MKTMTIAVLTLGLGLVALACGESSSAPVGEQTLLLSVVPRGGATGVDRAGPMTITFSHPMMDGMEEFADVHEGDIEGPLVPGGWSWNGTHTELSFMPMELLKAQTRYVIHIGGGMQDQSGHYLNFDEHGFGMGGQWMTQDMHHGAQHGYGGMGGMGGGMGMGIGWTHPTNGSYGMIFTFTTA